MDIIRKVHRTQGPGHVLAFFTGQDEIERAGRLLSEAVVKEAVDRRAMSLDEEEPDNGVCELMVVPLFGALSAEAQADAFKPAKAGVRKVTLQVQLEGGHMSYERRCFWLNWGNMVVKISCCLTPLWLQI